MTRTKITLLVGCLLAMVLCVSDAWTQQSPQKEVRQGRDVIRTDVNNYKTESRNSSLPVLPGEVSADSALNRTYGTSSMREAMSSMHIRPGAGLTRPKTISRTISETVYEPVPPEELEEFQAFQQARQTLKDASDEAERKKAAETIKLHLEKQFERDLTQREQDLAAIEERLKSLRQQLSKRQTAKDEIIALRLKTIVNSAEGLGFPGEESPHDRTIEAAVIEQGRALDMKTKMMPPGLPPRGVSAPGVK